MDTIAVNTMKRVCGGGGETLAGKTGRLSNTRHDTPEASPGKDLQYTWEILEVMEHLLT